MMIDLSRIIKIARHDGLTSTDAILKATEELGELASSHLCKHNISNKSRSSKPNTDEEGCDLIMCGFDYFIKDKVAEGKTDTEIVAELNAMLTKKTDKWERKMFGPKE
jgi:hypothetical protein